MAINYPVNDQFPISSQCYIAVFQCDWPQGGWFDGRLINQTDWVGRVLALLPRTVDWKPMVLNFKHQLVEPTSPHFKDAEATHW